MQVKSNMGYAGQPGPRRAVRGVLATLACLGLLAAASPSPTRPVAPALDASTASSVIGPAAGSPSTGSRPLVFAYYYIWYTASSWQRAKIDLPSLGAYDSRDRAVVAQQIAWARQAGIDGLIVSWKHTAMLDEALRIVVDEATKAGMKLILLYQGLDFNRLPLDDAVVASDMNWFLDTYAEAAPFEVFGNVPTIVWSGTWGYTNSQLARVRVAIGAPGRAQLLGSERSAVAYTSRAGYFDGDAYYWSSPDPENTPGYAKRLDQLAAAVRSDGGRWIAPAAPGFDARLIGGTSVVPRRDGATLRAAWNGALATDPDVIGIISWNEFSENSYIEPSKTYGDEYLKVAAQLIASLPGGQGTNGSSPSPPPGAPGPSSPASGSPGLAQGPTAGPGSGSVSGGGDNNLLGVAAGIGLIVGLVAIGLALRRRSLR